MFTDYELTLMTLMDEGLTREQAIETARFAVVSPDKIEAKRSEIVGRIETEKQAAYEASPEGRAKAALEAQARKAERDNLVQAARTLLTEEQGIDTSKMTEREVLVTARIEKPVRGEMSVQEWDREVEDLAQGWRHLSDDQRRAECRRLDQDYEQIGRYVDTFLSGPSGQLVGGEAA